MTAVATPLNLPDLETGIGRYLAAISKFPMLTAAEEERYARRWRERGDRDAAHCLVTSHLRLAAKIALRYKGYGLPVADLVSEANLGLMLAVRGFDPGLGYRLSTYALWWIKATVQDYVLRSWSLVKMGTTSAQKKLFFNLRKLRARLTPPESNALLPEDVKLLAEQLKVRPKDVTEMDSRLRGDISLQLPAGNTDHPQELQDTLVDPSPDAEELLSEAQKHRDMRDRIQAALTRLTPRERRIVQARYLADAPKTLQDLGQALDVSAERIRQIEQRGLEKLREALSRA